MYCEVLDAPVAEIVWFENSAHIPFFEEQKQFAEEMLAVRDDIFDSGQNQ